MTDRPIVQSSVELVEIPLAGPDTGDLDAAAITVAVAPAGGAFGSYAPVDSYDPATGILQVKVGPGTTLGELPLGTVWFRVRITDAPEIPVLPAGGLEVIA